MNWIQGLKFINLADFIFRPYGGDNPFNHINEGDYRYLKNTLVVDDLKNGDIEGITLTTRGYLWTAPGLMLGARSIALMPELAPGWDCHCCYGICSDYAT